MQNFKEPLSKAELISEELAKLRDTEMLKVVDKLGEICSKELSSYVNLKKVPYEFVINKFSSSLLLEQNIEFEMNKLMFKIFIAYEINCNRDTVEFSGVYKVYNLNETAQLFNKKLKTAYRYQWTDQNDNSKWKDFFIKALDDDLQVRTKEISKIRND